VVLASSADANEFEALRTALDADDAIDDATSSAEVEQSKPAPDLVRVALDKAQVKPDAAVFVGDTVWDVKAAGKAGVVCVGLLSGGIGRDDLAGAGAAAIYDGPAELLAALRDGPPERVLGRPRTD
jgi:phosphoglycolate phosphatase-like HAD superfamily hydrolase